MKDKKYYKKLAVEAARIIDSKKGEDIVVVDVESKTGLFYYAVIANAISSPHIKAVEEEIIKKFKTEFSEFLTHRDGIESNQWKVLDYNGIVIHILESQTRNFYALDKIYSDCKKIKWNKSSKDKTHKKLKPRKNSEKK